MTIKDIFDHLELKNIDEYIEKNQEENLHIDFKVINKSDLSHSDDKRNLSKALSGFANSSGGLLIWGIIARKNDEGIDCASGKQEIENAGIFLNKLNEFTGIAVSPIVEGVQHKPIFTEGNKGFVVSYIPESEIGPHMAKFKEDRYYKRSGDSFYRMEHFDVADMFGRRKTPKLSIYYKISHAGSSILSKGSEILDYRIMFGIKNEGRGSAQSIYFSIEKLKNFRVDSPPNPSICRQFSSYDPNWHRFAGLKDLTLHPGTYIDIIPIRGKFRADTLDVCDTTINYEIAADNIQLIKNSLSISRNEILAIYPNLTPVGS